MITINFDSSVSQSHHGSDVRCDDQAQERRQVIDARNVDDVHVVHSLMWKVGNICDQRGKCSRHRQYLVDQHAQVAFSDTVTGFIMLPSIVTLLCLRLVVGLDNEVAKRYTFRQASLDCNLLRRLRILFFTWFF